MTSPLRLATALALSAAVLTAGATGAAAHGSHEDRHDLSPRLAAQARAATATFHDSGRAVLAGYVPTDHCEPGMGQHWVNVAHLMDGAHDISRPDILLYEPTPSGVRLVGVEWMQPDADQDLSTDEDRPTLGGVPFDGPMLGHEPGMPVHYDLHVYLWKHNPDGLVSPYNPHVGC